jgi:hypothetical protein
MTASSALSENETMRLDRKIVTIRTTCPGRFYIRWPATASLSGQNPVPGDN